MKNFFHTYPILGTQKITLHFLWRYTVPVTLLQDTFTAQEWFRHCLSILLPILNGATPHIEYSPAPCSAALIASISTAGIVRTAQQFPYLSQEEF
jgi:hypothetical protein